MEGNFAADFVDLPDYLDLVNIYTSLLFRAIRSIRKIRGRRPQNPRRRPDKTAPWSMYLWDDHIKRPGQELEGDGQVACHVAVQVEGDPLG